MNFSETLEQLKLGHKGARAGWNGKGIFVELQIPDTHSRMTSPYIFIDSTGLQTENPNSPKNRVPWAPSQTDIMAEDWEILD